jgi:hypothetical protein
MEQELGYIPSEELVRMYYQDCRKLTTRHMNAQIRQAKVIRLISRFEGLESIIQQAEEYLKDFKEEPDEKALEIIKEEIPRQVQMVLSCLSNYLACLPGFSEENLNSLTALFYPNPALNEGTYQISKDGQFCSQLVHDFKETIPVYKPRRFIKHLYAEFFSYLKKNSFQKTNEYEVYAKDGAIFMKVSNELIQKLSKKAPPSDSVVVEEFSDKVF